MARGYLPLLAIVAAIWGASYMFIKVAVDEIEPTAMMCLRLILAAAVLVPVLFVVLGAREAVAEMRATGWGSFVVGLLNMALPFTLIAWGEKHIDSGIAAIANASVPIFVALLALRFNPGERVTGVRLAGVLVGFAGVGVLTGLHPEGGWWAIAGTLAVVAASLAYAFGGVYGQIRVHGTSGPVLAASSIVYGALFLLPLALVQAPADVPGWKALGSVLALGVAGTALAQLILFRALRLHGSARLSLVTYLMPPIALAYGALLLDEPITVGAIAGLGLILGGVALGSGGVRLPRREPAAVTPRP